MNIRKIASLLSLTLIIIGFVFIALTRVGFGSLVVRVNLAEGETITLNGKPITANEKIRLRPGSYILSFSSPASKPETKDVKISLFTEKSVEWNKEPRVPDNIIQSAIGSIGWYGPPTIINTVWIDDYWLIGDVGSSGGLNTIALHYKPEKLWYPAYFENYQGYNTDKNNLPPNIREVVKQLEEKHAKYQ